MSSGSGSLAVAAHPPVALPQALWDLACTRAQSFGVELSPYRQRVEALYGHLLGVNRWFNLTRLTEPHDFVFYHLLDSLSLLSDKRLKRLKDGAPIVDLGTGGGYPGLILAMLRPRHHWVLVDSRQRKIAFVREAASLLPEARIEARAFRGREAAAQAPDLYRRCQLVVSRAVGPVDRLLPECAPLLAPHGHLLVAKGPAYADEEHQRAQAVAGKHGFRFVNAGRVRLQDEDPERVLVSWERL